MVPGVPESPGEYAGDKEPWQAGDGAEAVHHEERYNLVLLVDEASGQGVATLVRHEQHQT